MTADATGKGAWRLTLGARIFLTTALLVALAVGVAVAVTYVLGHQIARQAVEQALRRSSSIQSSFQRERIERLRLMARVLGSDPNFTAYIAESLDLGDAVSILDQVEGRRNDLGFDFAIVLDQDGWTVARTDDPNSPGEDLSAEPLVLSALEEFEAYGVWAKDGRLFNAVAVPLSAGNLLQGFLILGFAIDDLVALELRRSTETEVAFFTSTPQQPVLVATTLESGIAQDLLRELSTQPELLGDGSGATREAEDQMALVLGRRRWLALVRPLEGVSGERVAATASLASLEDQLDPYRRIQWILTVVGLGTIVIASLFSYLLPRRVLKPIRELSLASQAAAEGDYDQEIVARRSDEVGQLSQAFAKLLSELREKRDMEVYISELARSLPDPQEASPKAADKEIAENRRVALLGVEIRGTGRGHNGPPDAAETLDRLGRDLGLISAAVSTNGGSIRALVGYRALASFEGSRLVSQALSAAVAIRSSWSRSRGAVEGRTVDLGYDGQGETTESLPALAVAMGDAVTGPVAWGESSQSTLAGGAVEQLENLLRVAKPGDLLLAQSTYQEVGEVLQQAGVDLNQQPGFSPTLPLFAMDAEMAARVSESDAAVTWDSSTLPTSGQATFSGIGPGARLGDRFEILSVLGAGGMGVVYKARDHKLDELVALKMLKHGWGDEDNLQRLKSELKLARKISHANVLRTFDFGEVNAIPFISMEYVRGITLRQLLDQSGRLPLSAGLRLSRQLCRGLEAAHSQGVLHRDIKPENFIIEPTGNAKLMDFGIARRLHTAGGQTETGFLIGTPFYLAPEQIQGTELDARVDLYACGVVFYEIFTGQLPYNTEGTVMQVLMRRTKEDPVAPSQYWPGIPKDLERLILRCLERDPGNRWPNVGELLTALETLRA